MHIVVERFIELSILQRKRKLSLSEFRELDESLTYLERFEWEKAKLKNLSLLASMTGNESWQLEICKELDQFNH